MAIRVLIVEDEMLVAEDIATDLIAHGFEVADTVISGEECINRFNELRPDVVIMDINIKGSLDGIETARKLNEKNRVPVIYLTANSDQKTFTKVLDVFPAAFISKPYNKSDLLIAIEVAFQQHNSSTPTPGKSTRITESVFIKSGNQYHKILLTDIKYVEADGSYASICTTNGSYVISYNLSYVEEMLAHPDLRRIHRSYIINVRAVSGLEGTSVIIDGKSFPVSKAHQREVMSWFTRL